MRTATLTVTKKKNRSGSITFYLRKGRCHWRMEDLVELDQVNLFFPEGFKEEDKEKVFEKYKDLKPVEVNRLSHTRIIR